jgi:hypothetical protein
MNSTHPASIRTDIFLRFATLRFDVPKYGLIAARLLSWSSFEGLLEYHFDGNMESGTNQSFRSGAMIGSMLNRAKLLSQQPLGDECHAEPYRLVLAETRTVFG